MDYPKKLNAQMAHDKASEVNRIDSEKIPDKALAEIWKAAKKGRPGCRITVHSAIERKTLVNFLKKKGFTIGEMSTESCIDVGW